VQATKDKAMKPSIVITELPYQTNKSAFVADVARLVEEQKLTGARNFPSFMYERSQQVLCTQKTILSAMPASIMVLLTVLVGCLDNTCIGNLNNHIRLTPQH